MKRSRAWFHVMLCQGMLLDSQSCVNQGSKGVSLPPCLAFCADMVAYGYSLLGLETPFVDLFLPVHTASDTNHVVTEQFLNKW